MKLPNIKGVKSPIVRSGNSKKSGVVPTTERRAAAQKRLESMNPDTRKKLSRNVTKSKSKAFAREFLKQYGLNESNLGKTKLFTETLGIFKPQLRNTSSESSIPLPSLDRPTRVSNDNNPTISSLQKQFKIVAEQLKLLESISRHQQDNKVLEIQNNNRKNQESILEKNATLQSGQNVGSSDLEPLNDQIAKLSSSISSLIDILEDKQKEANPNQNDDEDKQGFWDNIKDAYLGPDRKSKRVRKSRQSGSKSQLDAIEKIAANDNELASIAKRGNKGKVADVIGRGARKGGELAAKLGGNTTKAIEKLATPIIAKGLGKTVIKSIPIVGAVAGLGFAVGRLLQGDVVGAGLDAVSGLGGPLTAIPALIASTARDIYSSVYGVQPEEDPNASERMSEVTSVVKGIVSKFLSQSIEKKPPTQKDSTGSGSQSQAKPEMNKTDAGATGGGGGGGFAGGGGGFGGGGATGDFSEDGKSTEGSENSQSSSLSKVSKGTIWQGKDKDGLTTFVNKTNDPNTGKDKFETWTSADSAHYTIDEEQAITQINSRKLKSTNNPEANSIIDSLNQSKSNKKTEMAAQSSSDKPTEMVKSAQSPSDKPTEMISPEQRKDLNDAEFSSGVKKDASTLVQKSEQTKEMAKPRVYNSSTVSTLPSPQSVLTSKGTASVGNVPDPTYPLTGTLFDQLYFL